MSDYRFVLDKMLAEGQSVPSYVSYGKKEAGSKNTALPCYDPSDYPITSQENVWLSHLKLASQKEELHPLLYDSLTSKVAAAAERYGMAEDLNRVSDYVTRLRTKKAGIETQADYEKAKNWLFKNAEYLDQETATLLVDQLNNASVKLGCIPSWEEQYHLDEIAGRDPVTPEVQRYVDDNIHKLASGSVYTSDQFRCLSVAEVNEYLPDLMKTASLGFHTLIPERFGKIAESLNESQADLLDAMMQARGQQPIHSDYGCPIEINDAVLAAL